MVMTRQPSSSRNVEESPTEEVSNVETKRTGLADLREVVGDLVRFTRVDQLALRKDNQLVEQRDDVAAGLVDREHDRAVVVTSK